MSRIATGGGDEGETSLFGGQRVSKRHTAVEAYGAVDELNAVLGLVRARLDEGQDRWLERIQTELFAIGAELATPGGGATRIDQTHVDRLEAELPELKAFVLPGGGERAARLHLARTVCRRVERRTIELHESQTGPVRDVVRVYLNRLSDLLFLHARQAAIEAGGEISMDFSPFRSEE